MSEDGVLTKISINTGMYSRALALACSRLLLVGDSFTLPALHCSEKSWMHHVASLSGIEDYDEQVQSHGTVYDTAGSSLSLFLSPALNFSSVRSLSRGCG